MEIISALRHLTFLFFPKRCFECRKVIHNQQFICYSCEQEIPFLEEPMSPQHPMIQSTFMEIEILYAFALLKFNKGNIAQNLLHLNKYRGHKAIGKYLAQWVLDRVDYEQMEHKPHRIIPVPIHPKRMRKRGYNQVSLFAKTLAEHWKLVYDDESLVRTTHTKSQTTKNAAQRMISLKDAFALKDAKRLKNQHVILVDDILTTGATLANCCSVLQGIPGIKISLITMAYDT